MENKYYKNSFRRSRKFVKDIDDTNRYTFKLNFSFIKYIVFTVFTLLILLAFLGLGMIKGILDSTPSISDFHFGPTAFATRVYDRNGNLIDTLVQEGSNRENVTYNEIPKQLINAFVAIEDERFWEHSGIDFRSIIRALYGVISSDSSRGGGSTITQQLVKNAVFDTGLNEKGFEKYVRKLQEQYIALLYETQESMSKKEIKEQIITDYLNIINLGSNSLGVKVAAKKYFNKDVKDLTISESAVIASITKNPTKNNPITHPEENAKRREQVLENMKKLEYITEEEYNEAINDNVYSRIKNNDTSSLQIRTNIFSYFTDALIKQVQDDMNKKLGYSPMLIKNLLYSGGLKIYTTQDHNLQEIVDKHINDESNYTVKKYSIDYRLSIRHKNDTQTHYSQIDIDRYQKNTLKNEKYTGLFNTKEDAKKYIDSFKEYIIKSDDEIAGETINYVLEPQCSFVLIDQNTKEVLAVNGGRGEKTMSLSLNRATDTKRQPGSTFKVISSFAPALEIYDKTLATTYYDSEYSYKDKKFKNWYNNGYLGFENIRDGIIFSLNIIATRCIMETVSPEVGIEFAKKMGITSLSSKDYNPSSALGGITEGVSNIELTNAFATIANSGVYSKYKLYTKIIDHYGNVLLDNTKNNKTKIMSPENAYLLTDAMKESMEYKKSFSSTFTINSTSTRAHINNMPVAGKSGTTSNNNDVWFIGFTPYYTAGIWAGCDENQTLYNSKNKINNGGTSFHKNIWRKIMTDIHNEKEKKDFKKPNNIITRKVCRKSGLLATDGCTHDPRGDASYTEYFIDGTQPVKRCTFHSSNGTVNIPSIYQQLITEDSLYQDFSNMVVPVISPIIGPIINENYDQ